MKKHSPQNIILSLCIAILIFFMFTIFIRFFTKNILIDQLNLDNSFTRNIFYGIEKDFFPDNNEETNRIVTIDWGKIYPFESEALSVHTNDENDILTKLASKFNNIKTRLDTYTNSYLIGYQNFVSLSNQYEEFINWNIAQTTEYNGVVKLNDNYLTEYNEAHDVSNNISSLSYLADFCQKNNACFLYVQTPDKNCKEFGISGKIDFSNQNADNLLSGLAKENIFYLDLRDELHKENMDHLSLFFKTDHHWKGESGLWAASVLADNLNQQFGFSIDLSLYDENLFNTVSYKNWFLGSQGKKVTLARTEPDDINLIFPVFKTDFNYEIPDKQINLTGDFSVTYDMAQIETRDYYNLNPYAAYNYGNNSLIKIHNNLISNDVHLLLIKDSFGNCVAPFLALGVENIDIIDPRLFNGSIKNYIKTTEPNAVIVLYNPNSIKEIDWSAHTSEFDFR